MAGLPLLEWVRLPLQELSIIACMKLVYMINVLKKNLPD